MGSELEEKALVIYGGMLKAMRYLQQFKGHSSLMMDSFALTDQEKQLLSKEKQHFKYLIKMAKRFFLSNWKEKHFQRYKLPLMKRTVES